jgi:hypothetical protein
MHFFHWLYSSLGPWPLIFQLHNHFTDGMTPWTSDELVARPVPKHRATQTQNKHINIPNIHALCGVRAHDYGFRASEDNTCLRPLGYCDRPNYDSSCKKLGWTMVPVFTLNGEILFYVKLSIIILLSRPRFWELVQITVYVNLSDEQGFCITGWDCIRESVKWLAMS